MGRIEDRLSVLKQDKKKALALFVTAGYPERDSTVGIVQALEDGGADIIEIGMPFSDPLADGPVIQESSAAALKNGVTLESILETVAAVRTRSEIPLVLMGYLNPILRFGTEKFFTEASAAGVDGVILPELPLEESGRFRKTLAQCRLSQILLVTPTSSAERIRAIDIASSGFLYCVSTTGVTGGGTRIDPRNYLETVRRNSSRNSLLVGFGISTPSDAANMAEKSDGVIIGSALIRRLGQKNPLVGLSDWVRTFKTALR